MPWRIPEPHLARGPAVLRILYPLFAGAVIAVLTALVMRYVR